MKITSRHYKVIECLYSGMNKSQTAQHCKVSRQTLYTWLNDDDFKKAMREVANDKVSYIALKAVSTIESILDNPEAKDCDKLRASEDALNLADFTKTNDEIKVSVSYV